MRVVRNVPSSNYTKICLFDVLCNFALIWVKPTYWAIQTYEKIAHASFNSAMRVVRNVPSSNYAKIRLFDVLCNFALIQVKPSYWAIQFPKSKHMERLHMLALTV